jgi:hypothetical protein
MGYGFAGTGWWAGIVGFLASIAFWACLVVVVTWLSRALLGRHVEGGDRPERLDRSDRAGAGRGAPPAAGARGPWAWRGASVRGSGSGGRASAGVGWVGSGWSPAWSADEEQERSLAGRLDEQPAEGERSRC